MMKPTKHNRTEQGLTLMESLVAIMVIAIVVTALTPPMLIAFASRVKNYRASQAQKIAQGEIDRVRLLVERGQYNADVTAQLPPKDANSKISLKSLIDVGAPGATYRGPCSQPTVTVTASTAATSWCSVDINGDADINNTANWEKNWDLAVQTFRTYNPSKIDDIVNPTGNDNVDIPIAFWMGVRVYTRAALKASPTQLKPPGQNTSSLGLTAGEAITLPLVNRYVPIVRGDLQYSRFAYCELYKEIGIIQPDPDNTICTN